MLKSFLRQAELTQVLLSSSDFQLELQKMYENALSAIKLLAMDSPIMDIQWIWMLQILLCFDEYRKHHQCDFNPVFASEPSHADRP